MKCVVEVLVLFSVVSISLGMQCLRCRNIQYTSREQAVRKLLQGYSNPKCQKEGFETSTSGAVAVMCPDPTNGMEARCGYTSGRVSAKHTFEENKQSRTVNFNMDVTIWDCMQVQAGVETGCKGDNDVNIVENEFNHMVKSASFLRDTQVLSYTGDLCFCNSDRCTAFDGAVPSGVLSISVLIASVVLPILLVRLM